MYHIITITEMQQKIGEISLEIGKNPYLVTKHGKAKMVILPYYEDGSEAIEDYLEDYEMWLNRDALKEELRQSEASGLSDFVI